MKDERQLRSQLAAAQEIGEIKGRAEGQLAVAKKMLSAGVSVDKVV